MAAEDMAEVAVASVAAEVEPAPGAPAPAATSPQDWHRFTPDTVNATKCLARTWGNGLGGQCPKPPCTPSSLCACHMKKNGHGSVDGPIPEKKFQEFMRAGSSGAKSPKAPKAPRESGAALASTPSPREEGSSSLGQLSPSDDVLVEDGLQVKRRRLGAPTEKRPVLTEDGVEIKRPAMGGYGVFLAERRETIKASLPASHKMTDVGKQAGLLWKALPEEEKKDFTAKYDVRQAAFKEALLKMPEQITPVKRPAEVSPSDGMESSALKKKRLGAPTDKRPVLTEDGVEIKRPAFGGYGVFLAERSDAIKASLPADHKMKDVQKQAGLLWKSLPEEQKKEFTAKFAIRQAAFNEALLKMPKAITPVTEPTKREKVPVSMGDSVQKRKAAAADGFYVFLSENRDAIRESLPADHLVTEVVEQGTLLWKALSEEEKKGFHTKCAEKQAEASAADEATSTAGKLRRKRVW